MEEGENCKDTREARFLLLFLEQREGLGRGVPRRPCAHAAVFSLKLLCEEGGEGGGGQGDRLRNAREGDLAK